MISVVINPFTIKTLIVVPETEVQGEVEVVIDTGFTRCLISLPIVKQLGIKMGPLACPIFFEQVDGILICRALATLVTELVRLEMGQHREHIRFIIAPKITESIILGLTWLAKGDPPLCERKAMGS